jgi:hypothetical protein
MNACGEESEQSVQGFQLGSPHLHDPRRQPAKQQTCSQNSNVGVQSKRVRKADQQTNNRARQNRMNWKRNRCGQNPDRESAGESLKQHRPGHVRMLPENRHQDIDQTEDDPAQHTQRKTIHGKLSIPADTKSQAATDDVAAGEVCKHHIK